MDRLYFPATLRNREAIWEVLSDRVQPGHRVLEVASGSGEHLHHFRSRMPEVEWLSSDPVPEHRASIRAWNPQAAAPLALDVCQSEWPVPVGLDGVVAINLLHIAPWSATLGLMAGASRHLGESGWLYLYGAFLRRGRATAPSNLAFDQGLRSQNPEWGLRWLEEVASEAEKVGLLLEKVVEMPANNLSVLFRRRRRTIFREEGPSDVRNAEE